MCVCVCVCVCVTTRAGAEQAMLSYIDVAGALGLSINLQKTKLLVVGHNIMDEEKMPLLIGDSLIEYVKAFTYLGSVVASNTRINADVDRRISSASRTFGALRQAVFKDCNLTITTKRQVYQACVLSVLLYIQI